METPSLPPARNRRRRTLVKPLFQLRMIGAFAGIAVLALLSQFVLLGTRLSLMAEGMPDGGVYLVEETPGLLGEVLVVSLLVLLPATLMVGIATTFRIAGPLHRIEEHLRAVARGERPGPCQIRKKDQLQDLCRLVNEALEAQSREDVEEERPADAA